MEKKKLIILAFGVVFSLLIGCGGKQTPTGNGGPVYVVQAILVENIATDSARIDVILTKDGDRYTAADVTLKGLALTVLDSVYNRNFYASVISPDSTYQLRIRDSSSLDVTYGIALPGEVSITDAGFRYFTGSPEPVSWTGGGGSQGFILATTPPADAPTDSGFQVYTGLNTGTIPTEAFMDLLNPISGTHLIYVAAYTGAPVNSVAIPFDLPIINAPSDNVSETRVSGRLGGMVISLPDSIIVSDL